jgi:hypothetical protein
MNRIDLAFGVSGGARAAGRVRCGSGPSRPATGWKIRKFNAHLLECFSRHLKLEFNAIKSSEAFSVLCNYGAITA